MTIFTDKCKLFIPRLMNDLSITREQACGIFGNIGGETGGFKALQEIKPTIAGSRGGYGWMQWTGPRRRKYETWVKANNLNPAADETNYKYLVLETKTDEVHSLMKLRLTKTVEAATETFMAQNLRPGVPHLEGRIKWAKQADEATKAIVIDEKKADQQTGTVVVATAATGGLMYFFQEHWLAIASAGVFMTGFVAWLIHRKHEHDKDEILKQQASKKGKK